MIGQIVRLLDNDRGVTAIEYGLVAVVCIVASQLLGTSLSTTFSNIAGSV